MQRRQFTNSPRSHFAYVLTFSGLCNFIVFEKLTRVYSHQIALEIMFYLHEQNKIILRWKHFFSSGYFEFALVKLSVVYKGQSIFFLICFSFSLSLEALISLVIKPFIE